MQHAESNDTAGHLSGTDPQHTCMHKKGVGLELRSRRAYLDRACTKDSRKRW